MKNKEMTYEEYVKLEGESMYNPTLIFSLRSKNLLKKNPRYKHLIFNHVQIHFPYNGVIVEASKNLSTLKFESDATYRNFDGVSVILPLFIRPFKDGQNNFRYDKDMPIEYNSCASFVRQYLVKAGIFEDKEFTEYCVDDLYFELKENGLLPSIEIINKNHFEKLKDNNNTKTTL